MNNLSPIQVWTKALTKPNRESYEEIINDPGASLGKGIVWIAIAGFLGGFISGILGLIFKSNTLSTLGNYFGDYGVSIPRAGGGFLSVIGSTFGGAIGGVIGALIVTGIVQLVARALGGTGSFDQLFYGYAAFQAPLGLITTVLGAIPFVALCTSPILGIYGLVLMVIANQAAHKYDTGKAVISTLAPLLIIFLLCCCVFVVVGGITGAIFGTGASQFDWNSLMP